ncbi:MAG: radical SAM protein [Sorangiineae bacterium]|nr:radical SAM protein [Polyangiaceae bacterium]MEB2321828.1 radical SAM protein [Sorangiineae bacterium]
MSAPVERERYPRSPLPVLKDRDPHEDEDLLFLFLSEDQVFLKLTRTCNNICSFCCDTVFWNGTHMEAERVYAKIREGAAKGLKRLFLSGGEPTIHPDFIRFVHLGRTLGYDQIITITNGRMFFYEEFARKSVRAGLSEVIFSLNSHDEKTHDALVGVKGAYQQVVKGIANVRALGCPFRMNVVVTRKNFEQLAPMVRAYHTLGARSATFLQLVPNDRDWERSRNSIYYETELGRQAVRDALHVARELEFPVEFKKFPDNFFEDFEEHIPEPVGWALELAEIDWRRPDRHEPYKRGGAVKCWGERCAYCAYRPFCTHLMAHRETRTAARFDGFALDARRSVAPSFADALARQPEAPIRVAAPDAASAAPVLAEHAKRPRSLQLDSLAGVDSVPAEVGLVVGSAEALEAVAALPNPIEVELNVDTVRWLEAHHDWVIARGAALGVFPQVFLRLEAARRGQVELDRVFRALPLAEAHLTNIPACLSGRRESARARTFVDETLLREVEDVPAHAQHFYFERYLTKSDRCRECRLYDACDGVHINYVRQFGYRTLRPIKGEP